MERWSIRTAIHCGADAGACDTLDLSSWTDLHFFMSKSWILQPGAEVDGAIELIRDEGRVRREDLGGGD